MQAKSKFKIIVVAILSSTAALIVVCLDTCSRWKESADNPIKDVVIEMRVLRAFEGDSLVIIDKTNDPQINYRIWTYRNREKTFDGKDPAGRYFVLNPIPSGGYNIKYRLIKTGRSVFDTIFSGPAVERTIKHTEEPSNSHPVPVYAPLIGPPIYPHRVLIDSPFTLIDSNKNVSQVVWLRDGDQIGYDRHVIQTLNRSGVYRFSVRRKLFDHGQIPDFKFNIEAIDPTDIKARKLRNFLQACIDAHNAREAFPERDLIAIKNECIPDSSTRVTVIINQEKQFQKKFYDFADDLYYTRMNGRVARIIHVNINKINRNGKILDFTVYTR